MSEIIAFNGYSDGDVDTNFTNLRTLNEIADERFSRRQTIVGGLKASATAFLGTSVLAACSGDEVIGAPTALVNAGTDATISAGRLVTIAPTVANSGTFTVTQVAGPAVTLSGTGANRTFFAPGVAAPTTLTFRVNANNQIDDVNITVNPAELGFASVARTVADKVTVPAGHNVTVLTKLGDPILPGVPAFQNNGTDTNYAGRIGDHGDALYYYGLSAAGMRDDNSSIRGLIVQNHENLSVRYLHPNGPTSTNGVRPAAEAIKEIEAHGVSVTEVQDTGNRNWVVINNSALNRRITPNTPMQINGPARGSDFFKTVASPDGTTCRGTINNCANGYAEWGTNLTCEENWAGYFRRDNSGAGADTANRTARELTSLRRYGVNSTSGNYGWSTVSTTDPIYRRWDARAGTGAPTTDYRNEPNTFGWVVEIDPFNPASTPRKRTALGRFAHEGAWAGNLIEGQPVAFYMGCDSRREYFYKYVSNANWTEADRNRSDRLAVGDKYLDSGTLYVARFNADGTGSWLPLVFGQVPTRPAVGTEPAYVFESQADILVNTRLAADAVGATPMDRPEWTAVNPANGEVYLTLTNNNAALRPVTGTDAANPRHYVEPVGTGSTSGNPNGHIIRIRETNDRVSATTFRWDIYLFGADSTDANAANVNLSGLTAENDFSSPDGLWFARPQNPSGVGRPLLWIQTDDGAFTDRCNCMMLAALPGRVGDGGSKTITNTAANGATSTQTTLVGAAATSASLRRFLVGPLECEITGVDTTPDGRTVFVGIQHPGEDATDPNAPTSNWPANQNAAAPGVRPRSSVVAVTRQDGGIIGL
ncbi:MAG: PhoX family phosphatase [Erythrobacter sp.]|nr:PhoX family phosphatase [Erythrobacter sp.]